MKISKRDREILKYIVKAVYWNNLAHEDYARYMCYGYKKENADMAISLLKNTKHSSISYYSTMHTLDNGYTHVIHYFSIKVNGQAFQMSVHDPHNRDTKNHGTPMEWDHKSSMKTAKALNYMFKLGVDIRKE